MTAGLVLGGAVIAFVAWRWIALYIEPEKKCPLCRGKGTCIRCNYTGKVLKFGGRWVHPDRRRRK